MDNTIFCNNFKFTVFKYEKYRHNNCTDGVKLNYFAYMTRGRCSLRSGNRTVRIDEGDIFFIPSGYSYHSYWMGEPEIEFISLGFLFLPNFENRFFEPQVIKKSDEAVSLMFDIVNSPLDCVNVGRLYTLAGMLMPNMVYTVKSKQDTIIDTVRRLIASDPSCSVQKIAKECNLSESALYSTFKKHSDKSINDIRRSVVMERAKELLISTDIPIEMISQQLHFSSSSYFRKRFKEHFGASPREIRMREVF